MFPNGWPGRGLLLLRLGAGIVLAHDGVAKMLMAPEWHGIIGQSLATIGGVLLLIGILTPMGGGLILITEIWTALSRVRHIRKTTVVMGVGSGRGNPQSREQALDLRLFGRQRY